MRSKVVRRYGVGLRTEDSMGGSFGNGTAKGSVKKTAILKGVKAFVCVCPRLLAFASFACIFTSAFACLCLRLLAFARICLRPPLLRPFCVTLRKTPDP